MQNVNTVPVVITRPEKQAAPLASKVEAIGRTSVLFPLIDICPVDDVATLAARLTHLGDYVLVVFVSPNAVDAVMAQMTDWPQGVAIGVVGEGSRAALAHYGLTSANTTIIGPKDIQKSDSEGLLESLPLDTLVGERVCIIRGQHGRDFLTETLRSHDIVVEHITAYQRFCPTLNTQRQALLTQFLTCQHDWIITSSEALRNLVDIVRAYAGEEGVVKMQHQRIIATHNRISATAQSLGFSHVVMSGTGDEQVIATLQSLS